MGEEREKEEDLEVGAALCSNILSECGEVSKAKDPRVPARLRSWRSRCRFSSTRVDQHCIASIVQYI